MTCGDYRSESFADMLDIAGNVLILAASIAGTVGLFCGFTPLFVGAAVIGFAGMVSPSAYGLLDCIACNATAVRLDETLVADAEPYGFI